MDVLNDLNKIRELFKDALGDTLGVLSSPQLDSIKIALVTAALQSGTKGALKPEEASALAVQIVGILDGVGHTVSEDLKK